MGDFFVILQNIGIFIVLSQTLLHFRPNEEYEKYIKILSNIMILAMFAIPVMGIFQKGIGQDFSRQIKRYEEQMEQIELPEEKLNLSADSSISSSIDKGIETEVKTRLNKITPEGYEVAEVAIEGEKESVFIVLTKTEQEAERIQIEKVKLEKEIIPLELQDYKMKCAEILGIGEAYVEVVVRE